MPNELNTALRAYGLQPDAIADMAQGLYAQACRVTCGRSAYVARVRHELSGAGEVLFARKWALAVSAEVPVPVPMAPQGDVPRIDGRCVEVAPYLEHEHTDGGAVGPEAWVRVGRWVGAMHRLAAPLADEAPVGLLWGNHPNEAVVADFIARARRGLPAGWAERLALACRLIGEAQRRLAARRDDLPVGVVHGDMHFWNVLYSDGMPVGIVDLDFLQRGLLLGDLAYAHTWLTAWQRDRGGEWSDITERYLAAYEDGRQLPLSSAEHERLPWARVLNHALFFLNPMQLSWDRAAENLDDLQAAETLAREARRSR